MIIYSCIHLPNPLTLMLLNGPIVDHQEFVFESKPYLLLAFVINSGTPQRNYHESIVYI